jgi:serine/threonine protein kinase
VSTPNQPDDRLIADRYRLQRVIGRGAMGVVWLGYDEVLHRAVAVKEVQLPPGLPEGEAIAVRERTLREARAVAALTHPNVISVFDVARRREEPFVVMELLRSRSLADVVEGLGRCDEQQAASVADAVAAGLDAAHRRGVTHRDVKPGNVLIGDDGQIKLTDFGIARNLAEVTMTHSGMIMGTPAYIAPEVVSGDPVTPAADLWSLGAMLYAIGTGTLPYDKGDALETVMEVAQGQVPTPPPGTPLAEVIGLLMVKDPHARIGLNEVRRQIRTLLPEPGTRVFGSPRDESDGPADNKPTTKFRPQQPEPATPPAGSAPALAPDPGPLPFGAGASPGLAPDPGPLPFATGAPGPNSSPGLAADPGPLPLGAEPRPYPTGTLSGPPRTPPYGQASYGAPNYGPPTPPGGAPRGRARRKRRGGLATTLITLAAVVVFVLAVGGGFAAARAVAGQSLLPTASTPSGGGGSPSAPASAVTPVQFTSKSIQIVLSNNGDGGNIVVSVPDGWTEFVEQKSASQALPASVAVRWVNSSGNQEMSVERYPGFYPNRKLSQYVSSLTSDWQPNLAISSNTAITDQAGNDYDQPRYLQYSTTETGGTNNSAMSVARTTFTNVLPHGDDLWVLSVTVPTDQVDSGQTYLWDKVRNTLQWTD